MKQRRGALFFGFALSAGFLRAQDPVPLHFEDALRQARDGHVNVAVALDRLESSEARESETAAPRRPQVSATASQMRSTRNLESQGFKLPNQDPLIGPFNSFDARLRLTQILYDPVVARRMKAASADAALSRSELGKARQDAMILVAGLYIDAARAAERRDLFSALIARDQIQYETARAQKESGTGVAVDVARGQSALDATRAQESAVRTQARQKSIDLAQALNLDPATEFTFDQDIALDKDVAVSTDALNQHPDIVAARAQVASRQAEEETVRRDNYPKVSALADAGPSGKTPADSQLTYDFGAQASVAIFEGGGKKSRLRAAQSRRKESETRLADTESRLRARLLSAQEGAAVAQSDWEVQKQRKAVVQRERDLAEARWSQGVASRQDLLAARARFAQAQDDENAARYRWRWSRALVVESLGSIDLLLEEQR